jgi:protein-tyrosine-phosphatase
MNVLFVCTGNTCRSPMAEGIFNKLCKEKNISATCESAGLCTQNGLPASENAILALKELGIDISTHQSRQITPEILQKADLVLVMTQSHKNALDSTHAAVHLLDEDGISDPFMGNLEQYKTCRDQIQQAISKRMDEGMFDEN